MSALPIPARPRPRAAFPPVAGLLTAGLCGAALAAYVLLWLRLGHAEAAGSDFSASFVAALGWRGGTPLYDQGAQLALHRQLLPGFRIDLPFITPPTTAGLAVPSSLLDIDPAFRLMGALELSLVATAVALGLRHAPGRPARSPLDTAALGLAALAGVGSCVLLWQAQWDGVAALALAAAWLAWRQDRQLLAGVTLAAGFGATKPHLAIGLVAFLLATRRPRALAGLALGGAGVVAAGVVMAGPRVWVDWLGAVGLSSGHSPVASLLGFTGLAGSWLGDTPAARGLAGAASVAAVAGCAVLGDRVRRHPERLDGALAGAATLSLVAAPHLLTYDLAVLAPAAAWMLAGAVGTSRMRGVALIWGAINAAALLDLGNGSVGPPGRLVPLALTLAGTAALLQTAARSDHAEEAGHPVESVDVVHATDAQLAGGHGA